MYATNALTTIEKAASFLGMTDALEEEKQTEETKLQRFLVDAINTASAAIERYCHRQFGMQRHQQFIKRTTDLVFTDQYPVHALFVKGEEYTYIEYIDAEAGMVHLTQNLQGVFTYDAGYILPKDATEETPQTLPYDLEMLCLRAINSIFIDEDGYLGDVSDLKLGDWSTKLATAASKTDGLIPEDVARGLDRYKKIVFGEYDE